MVDAGEHLQERFARALRAVGAKAGGRELFDELIRRHGEAHRHYHTLGHVASCLRWLDQFHASAERPAEVELALWFHDAVYDPRRHDSERRSGDLARDRLSALGAPAPSIGRISSFVLATERHEAERGDAALVIDLDLAILGAEPAAYERFEAQIRAEYDHIPEPVFRLGRRRVLERFAARDAIFRTPPVAAELEERARANLARTIAALSP